jgi:putative transposase
MPDHLHVLAEGCREDANTARFVMRLRQVSGYAYRQRSGARLWQDGYHDHVLRKEDASLEIARYIVANPVRAGLCAHPREYPYIGSNRYSLDELLDSLG